jgi:hypothetical protein
VEKAVPAAELSINWRLQMYLYRGYFDAIVQARYIAQQADETLAREALATAPTVGSAQAIEAATSALNRNITDPAVTRWRDRLLDIWGMLNVSVGLSVLQGQETDLVSGLQVQSV